MKSYGRFRLMHARDMWFLQAELARGSRFPVTTFCFVLWALNTVCGVPTYAKFWCMCWPQLYFHHMLPVWHDYSDKVD